jgi:hypothetical protein
LVEGESKLTARQAYPATPGGVELGWEKRKRERQAASERAEADRAGPRRTQLVGRTGGDQVVVFDGELGLKGQLVDVEIVDARQMTLFARQAEQPVGVAS